jgi:hypothetical protein
MKKINITIFLTLISFVASFGQRWQAGYVVKQPDGRFVVPAWVFPNGDTLAHVELQEFIYTAPKFFANADDYNRYNRYRRLAPTVYPYAVEAIRTYRAMSAATRDYNRKNRKQYIAKLEDELDEKFRSKIKNMTRTQGFLLIKMIEKETHMSFYETMKDVKGGFSAWSWSQFGKVYGYNLSEGYSYGKDPILDAVLQDFNLTAEGITIK